MDRHGLISRGNIRSDADCLIFTSSVCALQVKMSVFRTAHSLCTLRDINLPSFQFCRWIVQKILQFDNQIILSRDKNSTTRMNRMNRRVQIGAALQRLLK